jgi:hypothetical protein
MPYFYIEHTTVLTPVPSIHQERNSRQFQVTAPTKEEYSRQYPKCGAK